MFVGWAFFGEKTKMHRRGVDEADALLLQDGREVRVHVLNERVVTAVGENEIDLGAGGDVGENFQRKAGNADSANLSRLLKLAHGGYGFVDDLFTIDEFDVMGDQEIEVICLEAAQRFVNAAFDAGGGEIERGHIIAAAF